MESEDDLQVGEGFEFSGGLVGEPGAVDADDRAAAAPVVVGRFEAAANDVGDGHDSELLIDHWILLGHTPARLSARWTFWSVAL